MSVFIHVMWKSKAEWFSTPHNTKGTQPANRLQNGLAYTYPSKSPSKPQEHLHHYLFLFDKRNGITHHLVRNLPSPSSVECGGGGR